MSARQAKVTQWAPFSSKDYQIMPFVDMYGSTVQHIKRNESDSERQTSYFLSDVQSWEVEDMKEEQIPQEKIMGMWERTRGKHDCSTRHAGMIMGEQDWSTRHMGMDMGEYDWSTWHTGMKMSQ